MSRTEYLNPEPHGLVVVKEILVPRIGSGWSYSSGLSVRVCTIDCRRPDCEEFGCNEDRRETRLRRGVYDLRGGGYITLLRGSRIPVHDQNSKLIPKGRKISR